MLYAEPAGDVDATVNWGVTGLGTSGTAALGVTIYDNIGGTTVARSTAGILEIATGIYAKVLTAPSVAGEYSIVWDAAGDVAADDLTVTSSLYVPVAPVDGGMTYGDILDNVLLDRFEATYRSRAGLAVNLRYAHLWGLEDWTFRYALFNPTVTSGSSALHSLPSDFGVPVYLWSDLGGAKLPYLEIADFQLHYLPATTGTAEAWTVVDGAVILGPTPTAAATWTCYYRRRLTPLSAETEVPMIPVEYRLALVHGGRSELLTSYDDPTAYFYEEQWQQDIDAMRREYLTDAEGQPDQWPSDTHTG